jgi:hypothetical protein
LSITTSFFSLLHVIFCSMLKHFKVGFCFLFTYYRGWMSSSLVQETWGSNRGLGTGSPD